MQNTICIAEAHKCLGFSLMTPHEKIPSYQGTAVHLVYILSLHALHKIRPTAAGSSPLNVTQMFSSNSQVRKNMV